MPESNEPHLETDPEKIEQQRALEIMLEFAKFKVGSQVVMPTPDAFREPKTRFNTELYAKSAGRLNAQVGTVVGAIFITKHDRLIPGMRVEYPVPRNSSELAQADFSIEEMASCNIALDLGDVPQHNYQKLLNSKFSAPFNGDYSEVIREYALGSKWVEATKDMYQVMGHGEIQQIISDINQYGEDAHKLYNNFLGHLRYCIESINEQITRHEEDTNEFWKVHLPQYRKAELLLNKLKSVIETALDTKEEK